jgi:Domain of unknown function (DUF4276)
VNRLIVFCEGQTEQQFCKQVLAPHLVPFGIVDVRPIRVAFSKSKGIVHRGGVRNYQPIKNDILNSFKQWQREPTSFTTMIDVYGLPDDFPKKRETRRNAIDPVRYVNELESAFADDIADPRFVPYLQLHEYEALLYVRPKAFQVAFERCEKVVSELEAIRDAHETVEHIDDGAETAPSKRISRLLPAYEGRKPTAGPDIAQAIGLGDLCANCPHFAQWLAKLERLGVS